MLPDWQHAVAWTRAELQMTGLSLDKVTKRFGSSVAVDSASFEIPEGEFWALLGPSGCGKTTILRMAAGFEEVSEGRIAIGDETMSEAGLHVPPERRRIGIVFQSYALWPHMTVAENVGYPLAVARIATTDRTRRIRDALASVGLSEYEARRPAELSGGQQQRVALARCLVMRPRVMLFDEPLANLDVHLRASMEEEFLRLHKALGATILYITHDQAEAMAMADRIVVMDKGRIRQIAEPRRLYREPATPMVAGFIGQGGLLPVDVLSRPEQGRAMVRIEGMEVTLRAADGQLPGPARASLRPEDLEAVEPGQGHLSAMVLRSTYQGRHDRVDVATEAGGRLVLHLDGHARAGSPIGIRIRDGWVIPMED